jgi:LytR cell envelope-related transcriptional attenuator
MAMLSFAFSIHNFISSVGADAGFAAIVGLAVLVLLYFAHARETANLREEAALLTQRLHQAEARVVQLTRSQSAAAPGPSAPAVREPEFAAFAPAFTAAPALGSATRMVSATAPPSVTPPSRLPVALPVPAMAGVAVGASEPPAIATSPAPPVAPAPPPVPPRSPLPAPATSAGGNGASRAAGTPAPVSAESDPPARALAASRPVTSRPLPPLQVRRARHSSRLGRGVVAALVALAAVAVAVVLFAVTSVGSPRHSGAASSNTSSANHAGAAAFKPSMVTVAVLNGTAINQLAHRIAAKLAGLGYKDGTIATAPNQTETSTVVSYLSGGRDRTDALHVATALGLRRSAVQPIDQSTLQVACPTTSGCPANVVVTVGSNLAGQ